MRLLAEADVARTGTGYAVGVLRLSLKGPQALRGEVEAPGQPQPRQRRVGDVVTNCAMRLPAARQCDQAAAGAAPVRRAGTRSRIPMSDGTARVAGARR